MPRAGNDARADKRYDACDDEDDDVNDVTAAADVGRSSVAVPDSPAAEMALAAAAYAAMECKRAERAADELRWLASHCHECGDVSDGNDLAGAHVPLCDSCVAEWVLRKLGPAMVADRLSRTVRRA